METILLGENISNPFILLLEEEPIYMPIKFIYKFFNIVFSKINDFRRVRIAINIAKYLKINTKI